MPKAIFKPVFQNQSPLFPYDFGAFIDKNHPARIINEVVDKLDITDILFTYKGGGASSYHPRTMLKVVIFGYLNNLYSSRKIEKATRENIYFMWLGGMNFPDHRTINNFRGKRLRDKIGEIFRQVVLLLQAGGFVTLEEAFTDGTKIESVANRYTFVWRKSVEKHKGKLENKIRCVLDEINEAIEQDNGQSPEDGGQQGTHPISPADLGKKIDEINRKLREVEAPKQIVKKVEKLQKESLPKLREYEGHLEIMGERNSYSKTDPDATFMRMKEDHMKNGQLKPAYNIQLSTENNFITNYSPHQTPGDTTTFEGHMNSFDDKYGKYPGRPIADSGYGSTGNYEFLEKNKIGNFVKFNYFHKEQTKKFKTDISRVENLHYNEGGGYFVCPMGQKMKPAGTGKRTSGTGYEYEVTFYQAQDCSRCPLRGACHKQKGNRMIEVNKKLYGYKQQARENLTGELGKELRGRRCSEVEQTFGQLKSNKGFKRFLLRGLPKISIEIGLLALAHNFQKLSKALKEQDLTKVCESISGIYRLILNKIWSIIENWSRKKRKIIQKNFYLKISRK